ncbi:MAG TPA: cytochrome bc complex cytochrome b subunit [Nocardioides sp.]|uniref:cytochrome bc1 complex cytochrome b subunit n=1 Tax=uncultured Nocardioides sp. TaxID=198441 RepID=UPI000EDE9535|nr:cytochrome bc complex cytochrome b subunit [uncultured Nocardioides sp.]HCB05445.1 ubiquinol-cytochrome c reductase cytochrome b subunit [Nocardioides sp.]HRD63939.1 cytochrome bc complex cytochrome b subunit [Nocardioides sp.]HRI97519.1 cytochrome bc complex cytochrome b subunit [Nocardioides sp.]HRK47373.1 cytochrome bc complex cytochrome b subunit [Nocardioides sp.]
MSIDTSRVATTNTTAATASRPHRIGAVAEWADDRLGLATMAKKNLRKVFPDHWSFMLGEIALWSFVILLLSGVFLTLWFTPSMGETTYEGTYAQMRGIEMSEAFASALRLSFDVRGGLLMRQIHHWAAMLFVASMMIHLLRVFFTGAHRKPRELNWAIGALLLLLGTLEGFTGYSLPDDLLSGTGIRAADGFIKSQPIVGTYMSFFLFGGEFPGDQIIPRLYIVHVLLIPGLLLALITAHMLLLVYHKHTQWPGPGRTEQNVVGFPMLPVYAAKAGGFFFIIFGITALMGGLLSINPVWKFGPYDPSKVTAGSQPDWYMGWPDGALRIMPNWETHIWGHTISWNVLLPIIVLPMLMFTILLLLPFIEAWITGDKRDHHLLQRPRNAPTRTATMVALMTMYGLFWAAGGNDIIAIKLHLSINQITWFMRFAVFIGPVIAFLIARRWCISLQRKDNDDLLHGYESGIIMRSPEGGYSERHLPLSPAHAYRLTARDRDPQVLDELPTGPDANGVEPRSGIGSRLAGLRHRLRVLMYADNVQKPTVQELEEGHHHAEHEHELQAPMEGHAADGHQFDGHHLVEGEKLRADD